MQRNLGLDILRTGSISLVLLHHSGITIPQLVRPGLGGLGVEFFFVLSGFLIGNILLNQLQKENSFKTIKTFWYRRWLRILPAYYFMILLKFIFIDHSVGLNIIYYLLFLQNNFYGIQFYDVTWSLVLEEWFYIMLPFFLTVFLKFNGAKLKNGLLFFVLFIVGEFALRFIYVQLKGGNFSGLNGNVLLRFDSFMIGVILAYLKINYVTIFNKLNNKLLFFTSILGLIGYLFLINSFKNPVSYFDNSTLLKTFHFSIVSIFIGLMIPSFFFLTIDGINKKVAKVISFIFTNFSKLTYSLYLVHPLFYFVLLTFNPNYNKLFFFLFTFVSAIALYYIVEKPFLKLRDKKIKE
ncbi:MAG: acyltransferase [Bacteroidota bacterium]|nr:acyltransferase [Bacteroidota bacterium]MDP3145757.1 acyltransferase [Bacteroidota bacterium]